jgi:hypothetical protein
MEDYGDSAFAVVPEARKQFMERLAQFAKLIPKDFGRGDAVAYTAKTFEKVREGESI